MNAARFRPGRALRRRAGSLAVGLWLVSASAPAGELPVLLGSIGVGTAKPARRDELRALLRAELSAVDFTRVKTSEHYLLSATLVRLDSSDLSGDAVRATCVVSVALLRDGGATLYAVIRGRATAEDARSRAETAESDALRAAVHSAMTRVPQALR